MPEFADVDEREFNWTIFVCLFFVVAIQLKDYSY